ncbi:hypothetical protein JHK82_048185 [Glycine max]|nr:hypothetical protein JHK85_048682 [Glycine max]KAG5098331.1 hypothetical protein JHK82_048185 [Glycine max]KAG5103124.1 hypothetical protein JHK84_048093 [Glycine max]
MSRVYVGNLDSRVTERDLEDEFRVFGVIRSVWVARRPPGYAFIDFDDRRDAQDAIRELDGKNGWRVELSHNSRGGGGGRGGRSGVTVLVGGPLGAVVCHLVDVATAGHLLIVGVRRSHMLMGIVDFEGWPFWALKHHLIPIGHPSPDDFDTKLPNVSCPSIM